MAEEDPRARLAYDRTLLANERTFAAWLRTGLAIAAVGLGVGHLVVAAGTAPPATARAVAEAFVVAGIAVIGFGAWRFGRVNRDLGRAGSPATAVPSAVVYLVALVLAGLLVGILLLLL